METAEMEDRHNDVVPRSEERDSSAILDRDLEETQGNAPKAQRHNWNQAGAHLKLLTSKTPVLAFAIEKSAERHRPQVADRR